MPVWVGALFWKVVLPDLIIWLQHKGYVNAASALAARGAVAVVSEIKSIKTYPEYPTGKNGA